MSEATTLAFHAVAILSRESRAVSVKSMASDLRASGAHLSKVLQRLEHAGFVCSTRGPGGGFTLAPRAAQRTLLEIYELFEGSLSEGNCLLSLPRCVGGSCILGSLVCSLNNKVRQHFVTTKIGSLSRSA